MDSNFVDNIKMKIQTFKTQKSELRGNNIQNLEFEINKDSLKKFKKSV